MNKRANAKQAARTAKQPGKLDIWLHTLEQRWLRLPTRWRIPLTLLCWLVGIGLVIGVPVLIQSLQAPGAALYGHNHTQRPIFSYWVNDKWGGNGGVTCCWRIQGDTLKVVWIVDSTPEQIAQGLHEERHELELPNPPRQREDDTLHVHFLPDNQVRLAWNRSATSPLAKELLEQFPRKRHDHL